VNCDGQEKRSVCVVQTPAAIKQTEVKSGKCGVGLQMQPVNGDLCRLRGQHRSINGSHRNAIDLTFRRRVGIRHQKNTNNSKSKLFSPPTQTAYTSPLCL